MVVHACRKYGINHNPFSGSDRWMENIYVEDEHKILYCLVPKVL